MNTQDIESLVRSILKNKTTPTIQSTPVLQIALFDDVTSAAEAAVKAFHRFNDTSSILRQKIVDDIRRELQPYRIQMAEMACEETGMGCVDDKIKKNEAALNNTPGTEDLDSTALTGDGGLTLFEYSPYGVIGSICPSTNPTETIINNCIGMLAAGNAVFFSPHPGAKNVSLWLIEKIENIIYQASGIHNLVVGVKDPSFQSTKEMMSHPEIPLLVVTGGPGIVDMAMKTGKKVIGAGAGNPPVIVDETVSCAKAAVDIIAGAAFDNNLPCIAEKVAIVVDQVADEMLNQFALNGACVVTGPDDIDRIRSVAVGDNGHANKAMVGQDPATILSAANVSFSGHPKLVVCEVSADDPLVLVEQLMPVLPFVRVPDFDSALALALEVEHGFLHTAVMHSRDVYRLNQAARKMRTSIFVKNAPSYAGLGIGAEGFCTFTIATPTGEGTTSARSFARRRRCVLSEAFNIR